MKEREQKLPDEKYPWLDPGDEWRHMTDREIFDKYINLDDSCFTKEEKKEFMDKLYEYRDAISLRDEIRTCPNIKVETDVIDKSPFYKAIPC